MIVKWLIAFWPKAVSGSSAGPQTYFVVISPVPKCIIGRDTEQTTRNIPTLVLWSSLTTIKSKKDQVEYPRIFILYKSTKLKQYYIEENSEINVPVRDLKDTG